MSAITRAIDLKDFGPVQRTPEPDECEDCGGQGEIQVSTGYGDVDVADCERCGGQGSVSALVEVAREALAHHP